MIKSQEPRFNIYLKELGYKKEDFILPKFDKRYKIDKKYGISDASTWGMYATILLSLYTYLRNFQDRFSKFGHPIEYTEEEWQKILNDIIEGLKSGIKLMNERPVDNKEYDKLDKSFKKGWEFLGDNLFGLWW